MQGKAVGKKGIVEKDFGKGLKEALDDCSEKGLDGGVLSIKLQQAKEQLSHARLKVTQARLWVLGVLSSSGRALTHLQIEALLAQSPVGKMDRVTLYRVLDCLVDAHLAHRVSGADRSWRFEACKQQAHQEGCHGDHDHPHFHCGYCDRFVCLAEVKSVPTLLWLPDGFESKKVDITIQGVCPSCR